MIQSDEQRLAVADLFGQAALGGDWPGALEALADLTGSERGQLIGVGADAAVPFNWMTRTDPAAIQEFLDIGGGDPALNPRVRVGVRDPEMRAYHDVDCSNDEQLRRNFVYADYCRRHDIPHGSQVTLLKDDRMLIGLAVLRGRGRGVPDSEDRLAFEALSGHVRAAVKTQLALEGRGAALLAGALDGLRIAAFVCDGQGLVQATTSACDAVLGRGVLALRGRRLTASNPVGARELEDAIAGARARLGSRFRSLVLRDAAGGSFEVADVIALPSLPYAFGFEPRVLVALRGTRDDPAEVARLLQVAFGLTAAESEVAVRIAGGEAVEAIGEARGVSVATVRSHLKNLYLKMNVSRQAELAARLDPFR